MNYTYRIKHKSLEKYAVICISEATYTAIIHISLFSSRLIKACFIKHNIFRDNLCDFEKREKLGISHLQFLITKLHSFDKTVYFKLNNNHEAPL